MIDIIDLSDTNLITFDLDQLTGNILVAFHRNDIFRTIVDGHFLTCVVSLKCWKESISTTLVPSHTMLNEFDGHPFPPHRLIATHPIELGGKIVQVDVEVVDAPIDYNLLLGHS